MAVPPWGRPRSTERLLSVVFQVLDSVLGECQTGHRDTTLAVWKCETMRRLQGHMGILPCGHLLTDC
jgi:hypothetical protein